MRRQTSQIRLLAIFAILLIGTALSSAATAQETGSASTSRTTAPAIEICEQRLNKALDAYEKANAALNAALGEIEARKSLDALKNEYLAVKDQIIAAQADLIKFYQSQKTKGKFRAVFEKVEKILLLAAGIYIGKGL